MTTPNTPQDNSTLDTYKQKVNAQVQEAKGRLEQFEATARQKGAQAEIAAANGLKAAKQSIDQKLQSLKATHEPEIAKAKAEIDADVSKFRASIDKLTGKSEKGQ